MGRVSDSSSKTARTPDRKTGDDMAVKSSSKADEHGCDYINAYSRDFHDNALFCIMTENKGRIVQSEKSYEPGDIIFVEPPLHIVKESTMENVDAEDPKETDTVLKCEYYTRLQKVCKDRDFDYDSLWYWCALNSLTAEDLPHIKNCPFSLISQDKQTKLLLLYHGDVAEASNDVMVLFEEFPCFRPFLDASQEMSLKKLAHKIESLLQVWILNCFEHSENPLGYSTYFYSSFMSHSCLPNAVWHYDENDNFVLRARRRIVRGDEVCCSYLSEDALIESAPTRVRSLDESKHFICDCERCTQNLDYCRGFLDPVTKRDTLFPLSACSQQTKQKWNPNEPLPLKLVKNVASAPDCNKFEIFELDPTSQYYKTLQLHWPQMLDEEKKLDNLYKSWDEKKEERGAHISELVSEEELCRAIEACNRWLSQHFLQERFWMLAQSWYDEQKQLDVSIHYAQMRINFCAKAYAGTSAAHAWAMEGLGDFYKRSYQRDAQNKLKGEVNLNEAVRLYQSAIRILSKMFGDGHEYTKSVLKKKAKVEGLLIKL